MGPGKSAKRIDRLVIWPLCVLSILVLGFFYFRSMEQALVAPLSLGEEGVSLFAGTMLSLGQNPYDPGFLTNHPWRCVGSPPNYFAVVSWLLRLTGPSLVTLRLVSGASFLILLVILHRIFAQSGASKLGRVVGLINFCAFWTVWAYAFRGTPDMLSLSLVALAIEQYMALARKPKDDSIFRFPRLIVIATLAVLAWLTKTSCAAVIPAIAAALIVGRQWRLSLVFMFLCSVLSVASVLILNNFTAGGYSAHTVFSVSSPFSWHSLREHLSWLSSDWLILAVSPLCLVSLIIAYFRGINERQGPYRQRLSAIVVMVTLFYLSFFVSIYVMGKAAAGVTDFFLILLAVAWMVSVSVDHMSRKFLILLFGAYFCGFYVIYSLLQNQTVQIGKMQDGLEIIRQIPFSKKLMLAEECTLPLVLDATPEFVNLPTMTSVWSSDPEVIASNLHQVKERIKAKDYGSIVINSHDGCLIKPYKYWDDSVIKLIKDNYKSTVEISVDGRAQDFYLPKK